MKWKVNDIINDNEYTGKIIDGYLILNKLQDNTYYAKKNNKIYTVSIKNGIIKSAKEKKRMDKLVNPYIHLNNNVTVIFTLNNKEIYIDTSDYIKVKGYQLRYVSKICVYCNNHTDKEISLCKLLYGITHKSINMDCRDFRKCNRVKRISSSNVDYNIIDTFLNSRYNNISIKEDDILIKGIEGKIYGGMQVLNKIDDIFYYVRIFDNDGWYISIESEADILKGNVRAKKEKRVKHGMPYIELRGDLVAVFTLNGGIFIVDKAIYYSRLTNVSIYKHRKNDKIDFQVYFDGKVVDLGSYIFENRYDRTKVIVHNNGNDCDFRIKNISIVSRSEYFRIVKNGKGVFERNGVFVASIAMNNKTIYLGSYKTEEEAINARKEAERKYWGMNK